MSKVLTPREIVEMAGAVRSVQATVATLQHSMNAEGGDFCRMMLPACLSMMHTLQSIGDRLEGVFPDELMEDE